MATSANDIQSRELRDTVLRLEGLVNTLQETVATLSAERSALQTERDVLKEQVEYLTKKLFGKKSEKGGEIPGQYSLFNEVEAEAAAAGPEDPGDDADEPKTRRRRRPRPTNEERFKGIPVRKEYLDLPEGANTCPSCGSELKCIGEEFVRRELEYVPAKVRVVEYYSRNYACPKGCKEGGTLPLIVKGKDGRPHMLYGMASASTVAWIMYQKYVNGVPLYRQEKEWQMYGAPLTRATMANLVIRNTRAFIHPLYGHFHRAMLGRAFLMADETPVQVLKEPDRRAETRSFMWLFRTGERDDIPIILFMYSETRAGENAKDFLGDYGGYVMCDGYSGYNKLKKAKRCSCWAHVRRYLLDAVPNGKKGDLAEPAVQGLCYVEKLYRIERGIKNARLRSEKSVRDARLAEAPQVISDFLAWADAQRPVRGSRLDKAITYIQNRRDTLDTYLQDGRCSFDNNASERCIKDFVIGRKNWLFSDTPQGAESSAEIYSVMATAKLNGLNPYHYMKYLLETLPSIDLTDDAELERVSPWNKETKEAVKRMMQDDPG